jgi:cellobiose phosphorylase
MEAVDQHLVRRDAKLIQLLDPPFDKSALQPGYIKGYVPGVRENGGQYTHGAIWAVIAFAELGETERAWELFSMLNPIGHATNPGEVDVYKVEPYVMAADVYATAPHTGRGGWTWYTGSAGWMYQAAIEGILGLQRHGTTFSVAPSIPAMWPKFSIEWQVDGTAYHISVVNPGHRCRGVGSAEIDGVAIDPDAIPLLNDGKIHYVVVEMGNPGAHRG